VVAGTLVIDERPRRHPLPRGNAARRGDGPQRIDRLRRGLSEPERRALALYLNADMIASPNAGYFVHDADDSDRIGAGPAPAGSGAIEQKLLGFMASVGVAAQATDLDGRSDYAAFLAAGVPVGGIFTGAQERKSAEQART
jgi:Zn-dependent M28 family amino/carboxypeptidase